MQLKPMYISQRTEYVRVVQRFIGKVKISASRIFNQHRNNGTKQKGNNSAFKHADGTAKRLVRIFKNRNIHGLVKDFRQKLNYKKQRDK